MTMNSDITMTCSLETSTITDLQP